MKRGLSALALALALIIGICPAAMAVSSSTRIYGGTTALKNNIDLAIEAINGSTLFTDDFFSFNDTVGPRTTECGYEKAINGRGVYVIGGGVSQVAATLYLALKKQGDITYVEKQVYGSNFTGDYVDSGNDAIVTDYKNDNDFSFINDGECFTIEMWRSGNTVYCSLEEDGGWYDDDYIFPESSDEYLTRRQILSIPKEDWGYARNEIYARHGYVFKTAKYRKYFSDKDWYYPGGFSTSDLNEIEWYNMDLIKAMEKEYGVR